MNDDDTTLRITVESNSSAVYIDITNGCACYIGGRYITGNPKLSHVLSHVPSHTSSSITVRLGTREVTLNDDQRSELLQYTVTTLYDKYSETTITIRDADSGDV